MDDENKDSASAKVTETVKSLLSSAEIQSQQANEARKAFEELRDKIVDFTQRPELGQALENIYAYGHTAGSASESALALREQLEVMAKMSAEIEKRAERDEERYKTSDIRDAEAAERFERQVKALEGLVDLAKGSAGLSVVNLAKSG